MSFVLHVHSPSSLEIKRSFRLYSLGKKIETLLVNRSPNQKNKKTKNQKQTINILQGAILQFPQSTQSKKCDR